MNTKEKIRSVKDEPLLFDDAGLKLPLNHFETKWMARGYKVIAGVDEAGRGPLAGPVMAAAVVLPEKIGPRSRLRELRDSKTLTPERRDELFDLVQERALAVSWAICTHQEIDELNILRASLEAMRRAVDSIKITPDLCLIDGNIALPGNMPSVAIVGGDGKSLSIAAASIVAKVTRDRMMLEYHEQYPHYNFQANKGYPTMDHKQAIIQHGPCPIHRRTFRGVREYLEEASEPNLWD